MKRKLIVGFLTLCCYCNCMSFCFMLPLTTTQTAALPVLTPAGSDWDANWADTAADFTKVSLTPGADDTQLNFAWYSEKT